MVLWWGAYSKAEDGCTFVWGSNAFGQLGVPPSAIQGGAGRPGAAPFVSVPRAVSTLVDRPVETVNCGSAGGIAICARATTRSPEVPSEGRSEEAVAEAPELPSWSGVVRIGATVPLFSGDEDALIEKLLFWVAP